MSDIQKVYVLHHKDMDGYFAAAAHFKAHQKSKTKDDYEVKYIAVRYGEPFPDIELNKQTSVVILDFSYDRQTLIDVNDQVDHLLVIDHHKTAQKNLEGLDFCVFDMSKSGNILAWEYFLRDTSIPTVHYLAQDYDLFTKKYPESEKLEAGIRASGSWNDLKFYIELQDNPKLVNSTITLGEKIFQYELNRCQDALDLRSYKVVQFHGLVTAVINWTANPNLIAEVLYETLDIQAVLVYYVRSDGRFKFSLRSKKDAGFKLNEIGEKYGGGGHDSSTGFLMNQDIGLEFIRRLYQNGI